MWKAPSASILDVNGSSSPASRKGSQGSQGNTYSPHHLSILLLTTCRFPTYPEPRKGARPQPRPTSLAPGKASRSTPPQYYNDCAVLQGTQLHQPTVCQATSQLFLQPSVLALKEYVWTGKTANFSPGSLTSSAGLFVKEKFQWAHPTHGTQVQKLYLSSPLPKRSHAP